MESSRRELARYNQASMELGFGQIWHPMSYEGPLILMSPGIKTNPRFMCESDMPEF